ncbi:hypothetical protein HAX54_015519 [Datura stramonium]|uniref:Pentatricopeptide repeat-containing protein n=1 Tax=Datura stramonium TaxID=4076 RepID=A0ABS8TRQ4_DATST|nr:hypothetical protein [Datura stramonium]
MEMRDTVSWNSIIMAYCHKGDITEARRLLDLMRLEGIEPGLITWNILIASYNQLGRCDEALEVMKEMEVNGIMPDVFTWTCLISDSSKLLRLVFDMIPEKDVYSWNSMIGGYCQAGYCGKAYDLFMKMHEFEVSPNVITWNVLMRTHKNGDEDQALDLFWRWEDGSIESEDAASWNALIAGYWKWTERQSIGAQSELEEAIDFIDNMTMGMIFLIGCIADCFRVHGQQVILKVPDSWIKKKMVVVPVAIIGDEMATNSNLFADKSPLLQGVDRSAVFWRKVLHELHVPEEKVEPWDDETFSGIKQMLLSRSSQAITESR